MLHPMKTAAHDLTSAVKETTRQLDAVGGAELTAAVSELEQAAKKAGDRLEDAAKAVRSTLAALAERLRGIARTLAVDLQAQPSGQDERPKQEAPAAEQQQPEAPSDRCPTCTSPSPELHPAMQHEGEVQPCRDPWHGPATASQGEAAEMTLTVAANAPVQQPAPAPAAAPAKKARKPRGTGAAT